MPAAGHPAPEFVLPISPDESVSLSQFRGRPVILAFYPADWSPVCGDQMALYQAIKPEFDRYDAALGRHPHGARRNAAPPRDADRLRRNHDHDTILHRDRPAGRTRQRRRSSLDPSGRMAKEFAGRVYHEKIRRDFIGGVRSGVNGTPTFFINGIRHDGGYTRPELLLAVDQA